MKKLLLIFAFFSLSCGVPGKTENVTITNKDKLISPNIFGSVYKSIIVFKCQHGKAAVTCNINNYYIYNIGETITAIYYSDTEQHNVNDIWF